MCNTLNIQRSRGFTLVELVISIVLIGILAVLGSSMLVDCFNTARMINSDNTSTSQARYAQERLAREIREVKFVSSGVTGNYTITTMTSTRMVFTKTVNGTDITVTINSSGSNLTLQYSSPAVTSTLSSQVSSFVLGYLDVSGAATTDTSLVRFVAITLTLTDPVGGQSIAQRTRVALRNTL